MFKNTYFKIIKDFGFATLTACITACLTDTKICSLAAEPILVPNTNQISTLKNFDDCFETIFLEMNQKKNSFLATCNILLKNELLICNAIRFMRDFHNNFNYDPMLHEIDNCYNSLLMKANKKVSELFLPIFNLGLGDCLFRSVSQSKFGTQSYHRMLRICSTFILIKKINFFRKNSSWNQDNMEAHIASIARNGVFGGEDEHVALSLIFKQPILIFSSFVPLEFNALSHEKTWPIVIFFDFKAEHFVALLSKENKNSLNLLGNIRPKNTVISELMDDIF